MELPFPFPALQEGGQLVSARRGINALTESSLMNKRKELENKYYGPNIESEIAQRKSVTKGQDILNQFSPEKLKLEMDNLRIAAAKNKMINYFMNNILQSNPKLAAQVNPQPNQPNKISNVPPVQNIPPANGLNINQNTQNSNYINQDNTSSPPAIQQNALVQPSPSPIPMQQGGSRQSSSSMTYPQAAMLSHLLGLKEPQIIDVNGQKIAVTPFGNIPVAQGLTPSEEAYQKGKGKYAGKSYGTNVDTYRALQAQDVALDEMISAIDNPEFYNVTGPVSSFFKKWAGTPEQKNLLGRLQSASGEIALQVAPSLKGAFTGRDQTLINTVKANPNTDFADVFIGKLKAQKLITTVLEERNRLAAHYKDQGLSPLDAEERAAKETPLDKYRDQIDNMIQHKYRVQSSDRTQRASGTKKQIDEFLKDHPDWSEVK